MLLDKNQLAKACTQFGTMTRSCFPLMKEYVYAFKKGRCIFNLDKILKSCYTTYDYVQELIKSGKSIFFLGTNKKTQEIIKEQAIRCKMPYINHKWVGGLLTNSGEIRKNIKKLQNLTFFTQKDSFKLLPKKEQAQINRDIKKLDKIYGGISNFNGKIDVLFVIGLKKEQVARREVNMLSIPIISLCNTNANPNGIDCILVGNDENIKSVEFFASWVADSILLARGESIEKKQEEIKQEDTENISQLQESPEITSETDKSKEEKTN